METLAFYFQMRTDAGCHWSVDNKRGRDRPGTLKRLTSLIGSGTEVAPSDLVVPSTFH